MNKCKTNIYEKIYHRIKIVRCGILKSGQIFENVRVDVTKPNENVT